MHEQTQIRNLLDNVSTLQRQHEHLCSITGEKFNIFQILKLSTAENRTHSAFIAELLSPKGSHGQGAIFLKLFLQECAITNLDEATSCVELERSYQGNNNEGKGRLDIRITDHKNNCVIIENKIYAKDQENQIGRYASYAKTHFQTYVIIYLTLNGRQPEGELPTDAEYKCCSYSNNITKWLEACRKEVPTLPTIRESITQYLTLIKQLTGKSMDEQFIFEIANDITRSGKNAINAFFALRDNRIYDAMIKSLIDRLFIQAQEISVELNLLYFHPDHLELLRDEDCIRFKLDHWR